ncbi:MAG: 4-(cytidine 5'-diphospho)-2-C-methyl-D-erythritol kinase [Candidatus Gastranaerophilales bacterium]|nr:4-(cytidine 5'-diphospho)-2-C-methyl-D-erythritol kinase [Candidatus Gastranaerophilales bacterium]
MKYFAPAKINLSLDVIKKREDGYHELKMIMQTISLYDELDIEKNDIILLECNKKNIPVDKRNLVWKAAEEFFKYTKIKGGCKIYINKVIPDGAGLGGGSSDAATVLMVLNKIYETNLTKQELINIGVKIGADVPFFIIGGTCLAEGIGEKLTKIENKTNPYILVYKPDFSISTKWVYENLNLNNKPYYNIDEIVDDLSNNNKAFATKIFNYLEDVSIKKFNEIEHIKSLLKTNGADGVLMSGSGSSVFGIFFNENLAKKAFNKLKNNNVFLTKFI